VELLLAITVRLDMTYAWLEAGRPIVHGPWSLPTGVRVADALGSFLFIVWAVNTRMLFASSWGKVKLALGSEASSEQNLFPFANSYRGERDLF